MRGEYFCAPKFFRVIKLIATTLFIGIIPVSATSFAQKITLNVKNAPLEKIFSQIQSQTGYDFFYNSNLIRKAKPVSLDISNSDLLTALDKCFTNQPFTYSVTERAVIIKEKPLLGELQQDKVIDLVGKIIDDTGQGIPGASIKVLGTAKGTMSDADGMFRIAGVEKGQVLVISSIGFESKEIKVSDSKEIVVKLLSASSALNDVVVVGYGTQKKVNLTGAVSVIKSQDLENRPVINATQRLAGLVPGLNVNATGNAKPGQSYGLNIRGVGNLSGTDNPFVLVDGTPMPLDRVNPDDIESISVLKDASASAIYGARAAYGVILVTTKKGVEGKTNVSYSNSIGLTSPIQLPDVVDAYNFAQYFNAATFNATGTKQYSEEKLSQLQQYIQNPSGFPVLPEANDNYLSNWENTANGVANTNWLDFNYKPFALRQTHNLNVSGGSKDIQYYISGGYNNEDGSLRYAEINFQRYNFNTSISAHITKWMKASVNSKFSQSRYSSPFSGAFENLFFHNMLRMRPNVSPYDLSGNFNEISGVPYLRSGSENINRENAISISPSLRITPLKNWNINVDFNILRTNTDDAALLIPGIVYGIDGTPKFVNRSEYGIVLTGGYSRGSATNTYISPNIYTAYEIKLDSGHQFNFLGGYQQELNQFESLSSGAQDLISFATPGLILTTSPAVSGEARNEWATKGFFGRINYNYKNKYLLEANARYDGSSRFAPGKRWGFFPSVSLGYNIAEEEFIKNGSKFINVLKLRGSYGTLGNQAGAPIYSYAQTMRTSVPGASGAGPQWYFQNGREANIFAPAPYNPALTWEKVLSGNLGLDFELLSNRLTGSLDIYQRNTKNMLGPSFDIADMFGGVVPSSNNADLRTRGWELSLNWKGKIGQEIAYRLGGTLSDYKSVVTRYQNPTFNNPAGSFYEGKDIGEIWGYRSDGLIQNAAEAAEYNKLNRSFISPLDWKPGDVRYLDLNNDGKISNGSNKLGDMGDLTVIGNTNPRYTYSLNGSMSWKGLTLSVLLQGIGKKNYAPGIGDVYFWGAGALAQVTVFEQHLDFWTPQNAGAYYPNPYAAPAGSQNSFSNKTQQVTDRYLQSASYLRLKNATLNYSLPKQWVNKIKLSKVNLFVSGENLFVITNLAKMFDPEGLTGSVGTGKAYPLSKVYAFGLNVSL
ncbi:hypothetical protein ASE74_04470 [Pedobacter sp. Leaf216]|nr:hypothetical protein ASE74_04470 [Pedobacter sp. Leaf216]